MSLQVPVSGYGPPEAARTVTQSEIPGPGRGPTRNRRAQPTRTRDPGPGGGDSDAAVAGGRSEIKLTHWQSRHGLRLNQSTFTASYPGRGRQCPA